MPKITRRSAIFSSVSLAGASLAACSGESGNPDIEFNHGVASGDPTHNAVIIWTRLTPDENKPIRGKWQMSDTNEFKRIRKKGKFETTSAQDFTVKIDAQGLQPGQIYYYRFKVGKDYSPIGRTRTLPTDHIESARFAVVSCSNYPFGFFNVYAHIAQNPDFDAVIHLGDYFYEYGRDSYGGKTGAQIGREHEPPHEIISLADYRTRHAQYKADIASRAMLATHPLICIWDDHETANDSWKTGAENHDPLKEGTWDDRRSNAMQSYYEWMPVRNPEPGNPKEALFRTFRYGDLLTLTSIETRLTARHRPIDYAQYIPEFKNREGVGNFVTEILGDPDRELLSDAQKQHVSSALGASKSNDEPWRIIANQVIMARIHSPDLTEYKGEAFIDEVAKTFPPIHDYIALSPLGLPLNLDAWDGYPAARESFYALAKAQNVNDLIVLTGDTHEFWANKLVDRSGVAMGVELATAGVTSPGTGAYFGKVGPDYSRRLTEKNDDVLYHNLEHHGYVDLRLDQDNGRADFIAIDTVLKPEYSASILKSFILKKQDKTIKLEAF